MKFSAAILLLAAFVAVAYAEEPAARKLDPVNEAEPSQAQGRDKRGFVLSAYTAPAAVAAVDVAPAYTAAYTAPVAAAYTGLPYAYSAYSAYSPYASYYNYPAVYV